MNSLPKEIIRYQTGLHWIIFFWPVVLLVIGVCAYSYQYYLGAVGLLFIGCSVLLGIMNLLSYLSSHITITDNHVIVQTGILIRQTQDIPRNKIESLDIQQSILGSLLDYGNVVITGTGGSKTRLNRIAHPLTCRRHLETA